MRRAGNDWTKAFGSSVNVENDDIAPLGIFTPIRTETRRVTKCIHNLIQMIICKSDCNAVVGLTCG